MSYEVNEKKHSSGVAKAGLTLGIIGTGLAALGMNGNGLGSILNGNTTRAEAEQSRISELESVIAELKSARYTDAVGMDLYKNIVAVSKEDDAKISALQSQLFGFVIDLDKRTALNAQAAELNRAYDNMARNYEMTILNNKIDCCCEKANMKVDFNKQLGEITDCSILGYVNSNFIPGTLYLPAASITPPVTIA
jgi:hypothetical protein